jgi:hypothetical protein
LGVVGGNRYAKIMPLKFLSAAGSGATSDAVEAIDHAIDNGAWVMNHSGGGGRYSQCLADAFTASQNAGIVMAVAAGNDLDYAQVKDAILGSVNPRTALAGKTVTGGRLNPNAAVAAIGNPPPTNLPPVANAGADIGLARGPPPR